MSAPLLNMYDHYSSPCMPAVPCPCICVRARAFKQPRSVGNGVSGYTPWWSTPLWSQVNLPSCLGLTSWLLGSMMVSCRVISR
jgi:hypothetical protein